MSGKKVFKDFMSMLMKAIKSGRTDLAITNLKYNYNFVDTMYIINNLKKIYKNYNRSIWGNVLPKNYSELMKGYSTRIRKKNLEKELIWQYIVIEEFQQEINEFLKYKTKFEKEFFQGRYDNAKKNLDYIEKNICVSIWSIENRLIIEDLSNGMEANKNEVDRITSFNDNNFLKAIIQCISTRVEDSISLNRYRNFLNKIIDGDKSIHSFFRYILDYPNVIGGETDLQEILYIQSGNSIIDIYLTYVNIVRILLLNIDEYDLDYKRIEKNLCNLKEIIDDPRLDKIIYAISKDYSIKTFSGFEEFIEICDEYTIGNYKKSINLIKEKILQHTDSVQVYEIYILSCINEEIEFENIYNEKSLGYRILNDMYNILTKNSDLQGSISNLLKILRMMGNNELSLQIYGFINKYCAHTTNALVSKIAEVSSYYLTPRFIKVYDDNRDKLIFLQELRKCFKNYETIDFYSDILKKNNLLDRNCDLLRKKLYKTNSELEDGLYKQAIESYLDIMSNELREIKIEKYNFLFENILIKLYKAYIKNNQIEEAIDLIVDNYIKNKGYTYRIDKSLVVNRLLETENLDLTNISIPLFYYINDSKDKGNIFSAYDNYLFSMNIEKPSQIKKYLNKIDKPKLIMFLNNICTLDIMEDSYFFENAEELENERILVCQLLIEIDEKNSEIYMKEIKQITEKIMIRKGIKRVDESKIFVDVAKIKDYLKDSIEETFNRYIEISKMKKVYIEFDFMSIKDISNSIEYVNIVPGNMNLFKEMFLEIRDYFISSNEYGLDSYLSTRIRHGTLLGQLRKTFEIYKLITSKEAKEDNRYGINEYWLEKLTFYNEDEKEKFNNILREFSKRIDENITEVTSVWIKIKVSDNEIEKDRLFDYRIFKEDYNKYYKDMEFITDYNEFINKVLEILFDITNKNLENIRKKITVDLNNSLLGILNNLENDLKEIIYKADSNQKELFKNIAMCRTNIQHEISSISNWFYLSKNLDDNVYTFKELFNISREILNSSYPKFKDINLDMNINVLKEIKGSEYAYYIDILLILFSNILQRSKLEPYQIKVNIQAYQDNNNIVIEIINNHNVDECIIKQSIEESREKINNVDSYSEFSRQEGGTGFVKVEKMLKYNLRVRHKLELYGDNEKFEVKISFELNKE